MEALRFIHGAKSAGFTLQEINQLLELWLRRRGSCAEVGGFFDRKVEALDRQIENLRRMRVTMPKMRAACKERKRHETCLALCHLEEA